MKNAVGPKIREIRTSKAITQDALSARLNKKGLLIDRSAISRIEKQERRVTDLELIAISTILKVNVSELFK